MQRGQSDASTMQPPSHAPSITEPSYGLEWRHTAAWMMQRPAALHTASAGVDVMAARIGRATCAWRVGMRYA